MPVLLSFHSPSSKQQPGILCKSKSLFIYPLFKSSQCLLLHIEKTWNPSWAPGSYFCGMSLARRFVLLGPRASYLHIGIVTCCAWCVIFLDLWTCNMPHPVISSCVFWPWPFFLGNPRNALMSLSYDNCASDVRHIIIYISGHGQGVVHSLQACCTSQDSLCYVVVTSNPQGSVD